MSGSHIFLCDLILQRSYSKLSVAGFVNPCGYYRRIKRVNAVI